MVLEEMSFEEFQDGNHGGHLGYQSDISLNKGSGADVVSRFSRWPPNGPSWIAKRNNFSNSESLRRSDASHQVSA